MKHYSRQILILSGFALFFVASLRAKEPLWQTVFGTEKYTGLSRKNLPEDLPAALFVSETGALYVVGTNNMSEGNPKPGTMGRWLMRFSASGVEQWWRIVPTSESYPVYTTSSDDGFLIASENLNNVGSPVPGTQVLKFGSDGAIQWRKVILPAQICLKDAGCALDGGKPVKIFFANGELRIIAVEQFRQPDPVSSESGFRLFRRYVILRLTDSGEIKSLSTIGEKEVCDDYRKSEDFFTVVKDGRLFNVETRAESYKVTVSSFSPEGVPQHEWEITARTYRSGAGIVDLGNGEVLISHLDQGMKPASTLIRVDAAGKIVSRVQKEVLAYFGGQARLPDGTFLTIGSVSNSGEGDNSLVRMTWDGNILAKKKFGGPGTSAIDFALLPSGDIIILCYTKDYGAWYIDGLLMKVDSAWNFAPPPRRQ